MIRSTSRADETRGSVLNAGVVIFDSIEDAEYSLQQLIGATDTPHFFEYLKG